MLELPATTSGEQLASYALCPRRFKFRHIDRAEPERRSVSQILDAVVRGAIIWWFTERLAGQEPTMEDADAVAAADLLAETCVAKVRWRNETPESIEATAQALVRAYLAEYGDLPVIAVEQPFKVDISDPETSEYIERPLVGSFDLIIGNGDKIVHLKTTARGWSKLSLKRHLPIGAIVAAANVLHGGPSRVTVHTLLRQKRPRVELHRVERGEADNRWFFEAAKDIEAAIHAGHFPPSPGARCRDCEFAARCLGEQAELGAMPAPSATPPAAIGV